MNSLHNNDKITVLVVGANGLLGSHITKQLLQQPNLITSILIRDRQKSKELADQVEKVGGRVIIADIEKPETLVGVTKGIHTVISAVNSFLNHDFFLGAQKNLVDEAVKSGVQRFVPSDYGGNFFEFTREEIAPYPHLYTKFEFSDYLKTLPIKTLHFWTGGLLEFCLEHFQNLTYWGDNADRKLDFTSYEDVAKFIAAAVAKKDQTGTLVFVSESLSLNELSALYNRLRGTNVVPKRLGSLADVQKLYEEKKKAGDAKGALFAGLDLVINDPRASFDKNNNADFPEVKTTSIEEFLKSHPEVKFV